MKSQTYIDEVNIVISAKVTLEAARLRKGAFTRNRTMSFTDALRLLLDMKKTTLQTRLNMYYNKAGECKQMSQQAFSKARMGFDHSPFETMLRTTVKQEYNSTDVTLWHGYHVFSVDGSFLQLPRALELYEYFGIHGRPPQCPNAGISVLYDVVHGWAVDPILTTATMNERTECENHVNHLSQEFPNVAKKSIILLDRGYQSMELAKKIDSQSVKFVMRATSKFIKEVQEAPLGDTIVTRDGIKLRVIKFVLPNNEIETLVTNLYDLPEALFPELYAMRWKIETAYFKLKRELCVEKFSGKTVNSIYQDFWASMVLLNAVTVFQAEADAAIQDQAATKNNKHSYRARTSDLIITLRDRFIFAVYCGDPEFATHEIEAVIKTIVRSVSPVRPNRSFPRRHRPFSKVNANLKSYL